MYMCTCTCTRCAHTCGPSCIQEGVHAHTDPSAPQVPFADRSPVQTAVSTSLHGHRPALPLRTPIPVVQLCTRAWSQAPSERPVFSAIRDAIDALDDPASGLLSAEDVEWLDHPLGHPVYDPKTEREVPVL